MNIVRFFTCLGLILCPLRPAFANSGSAVGGATVEDGKTAVEFRIAAGEDDKASADKRLRTRIHIDHAFNDIYAARLVIIQDKRKGANMEHSGISLQNRFHLIKKEKYGFDGGMRLNYTYADGDKKPDEASLRFYQQIPIEKWEIRFNQIFEHEIGEDADSGLILEWRSQVTRAVNDNTRLGIDLFHDFGNMRHQDGYSAQHHAVGPVVKAKFGGGCSMEAAYRVGISRDAPDQTATLILTKSW